MRGLLLVVDSACACSFSLPPAGTSAQLLQAVPWPVLSARNACAAHCAAKHAPALAQRRSVRLDKRCMQGVRRPRSGALGQARASIYCDAGAAAPPVRVPAAVASPVLVRQGQAAWQLRAAPPARATSVSRRGDASGHRTEGLGVAGLGLPPREQAAAPAALAARRGLAARMAAPASAWCAPGHAVAGTAVRAAASSAVAAASWRSCIRAEGNCGSWQQPWGMHSAATLPEQRVAEMSSR